MRLIVVGCEYAGKTTLMEKVAKWWEDKVGAKLPIHDHFTYPFGGNGETEHERAGGDEGLEKLAALEPGGREMFQRYLMEYHLGAGFDTDYDLVLVGFHIEEAVYAPHYYGYGMPEVYGDREGYARHVDHMIMKYRPDTVLVLVTASPETIRKRMKENPHPGGVLQEKDVEYILGRFKDEHSKSFIRRKFVIDTTDAPVEESLKRFLKSMEPHFTPIDILRILLHRFLEEEIG